jgi:hypothetical protein
MKDKIEQEVRLGDRVVYLTTRKFGPGSIADLGVGKVIALDTRPEQDGVVIEPDTRGALVTRFASSVVRLEASR